MDPGILSTSAQALRPFPPPRDVKGAITPLWGDKTSGVYTIILGLFSQKPPDNKPLGLPDREAVQGRRRGHAEAGAGREQALGAPVLGRGHKEEPEGMGTRSCRAACPHCSHSQATCPPSDIKAHYPGAIFGAH